MNSTLNSKKWHHIIMNAMAHKKLPVVPGDMIFSVSNYTKNIRWHGFIIASRAVNTSYDQKLQESYPTQDVCVFSDSTMYTIVLDFRTYDELWMIQKHNTLCTV